jgi:hypothetical protein
MDISDAIEVGENTYNQTEGNLEKALHEGIMFYHNTRTESLARLLIEARDALPAISMTSARLHNVSLSLANRIEQALKPWEIQE